MKNEYLEVGDKLHITNGFSGANWFKITRVTKTLAFCKLANGIEYSFKRLISSNMSHPKRVWDLNNYRVERKL